MTQHEDSDEADVPQAPGAFPEQSTSAEPSRGTRDDVIGSGAAALALVIVGLLVQAHVNRILGVLLILAAVLMYAVVILTALFAHHAASDDPSAAARRGEGGR